MTVEDVSEKLGTLTRYMQLIALSLIFFYAMNLDEETKTEKDSNQIAIKSKVEEAPAQSPEPVDWKPQDKCYFCVDGKLLKVNEIGKLVVEAGPVQPETELNKHVSRLMTPGNNLHLLIGGSISFVQIIESDDSSSSSDTNQKLVHHQQLPSHLIPKNLEAFLKTIAGDHNMTSLESMAAAQIAAIQRMPELNQFNPFYPSKFKVFKTFYNVA